MSDLPKGSKITVSEFGRTPLITIPRPLDGSLIVMKLVPYILAIASLSVALFIYLVATSMQQRRSESFAKDFFDKLVPPDSPYAMPKPLIPDLEVYTIYLIVGGWIVLSVPAIWLLTSLIKDRAVSRAETLRLGSDGFIHDRGDPVGRYADIPTAFIDLAGLSALKLENLPDGNRLTVTYAGAHYELGEKATDAERIWLHDYLRAQYPTTSMAQSSSG